MHDHKERDLREASLRDELLAARCTIHGVGVTARITQFESGHFEVRWTSSVCCDAFKQELIAIGTKHQP